MNSDGHSGPQAPPGAVVPGVEYLCELNARLQDPVVIGATPAGLKRMVPIVGGRFEGPRLRGTGVPGGATGNTSAAMASGCSTRSICCAPMTA